MKTFTLQEANRLLPILRAEIQRLRPLYSQLLDGWEQVAKEHDLSVADKKVQDICLGDPAIRELHTQVEQSFRFFRDLGVQCKGIEEGLFDFPCLFEDRIVFLCWTDEEDSVQHWHELDSGYAGRKQLFEKVSKFPAESVLH